MFIACDSQSDYYISCRSANVKTVWAAKELGALVDAMKGFMLLAGLARLPLVVTFNKLDFRLKLKFLYLFS